MVQEVESFKPQLNLLLLPDGEVLVKRQIAVEQRRTLDVRPDDVSNLTRSRRSKAGGVKVLSGFEARSWVANQDRNQWSGIGSQIRRVADRVVGSVMQHGAVCGVEGGIAVGSGIILDRRPALPLRDARELPSVYDAAEELIAMHRTRKVDNVRRIENVRAIIRQHPIVRAKIVRVFG